MKLGKYRVEVLPSKGLTKKRITIFNFIIVFFKKLVGGKQCECTFRSPSLSCGIYLTPEQIY